MRSFFSNISQIATGKVLTAVLSSLNIIILTRGYAIEEIGVYFALSSMAVIVTMVANWGVNELVFRECSIFWQDAPYLIMHSKISKLTLGVLIGIGATAWVMVTQVNPIAVWLWMALLAANLIDAQTLSYIMVFRAGRKTVAEAILFPVRGLLKVISTAALIGFGASLFHVVIAFAVVNALGLLAAQYWYRVGGWPIVPQQFRLSHAIRTLKQATPYAIINVISAFYGQLSPVLIATLHSEKEAALYGVPMQFYDGVSFVAVSFNLAIQPKLTMLYETDVARWRGLVRRSLMLIVPTGFMISTVTVMLGPTALSLMFGNRYAAASPTLQVLMVAAGLRFVNAGLLIPMLISADRASMLLRYQAMTLVVFLALNVALVQDLGAIGSARALVASETILVVAMIWWFFTTPASKAESVK